MLNSLNHSIIVRYFLATGLLSMAVAIIYFSYSIIYTIDHAPEILASIDKTSIHVERALDEIEKVSDQIPPIIEQVDAIQKQLPRILDEIEADRLLVPEILKEVEQLRNQLPVIVGEVAAVRKQVPIIINEMEAYRLALPEVLAEVKAVRESLPPLLGRTEKLVEEAKGIGQKASEGAVKGVFTGIVKAPFSWMGSLGKNLFPKSGLAESDYAKVREITELALSAEIGSSHPWENTQTGFSGEAIALSEYKREDKTCRKIRELIYRKNRQLGNQDIEVCQNKDGGWELVE